MSTKKKKHSVNKLNMVTRIIVIVLALAMVISTIAIIPLATKSEENSITAEFLYEKASDAIKDYDYATLKISQQETTVVDDVSAVSPTDAYVVTTERNGSYRTYAYQNTDGVAIQQGWVLNEDTGLYDVYLYADSYGTWVKTELDEEPVANDIWAMFTKPEGYLVYEETAEWFDTGDECYVLQQFAENDTWDYMYEEVYIRKSDYMPMGMVFFVSKSDETAEEAVSDIHINDGESAEFTVDNTTIVQKYAITYSEESTALFDIPEKFITDEEFMSLIQSNNEEAE